MSNDSTQSNPTKAGTQPQVAEDTSRFVQAPTGATSVIEAVYDPARFYAAR